MYCEWTSLQSALQTEDSSLSVLNKFSSFAGKDVATAVVKHLSHNLGGITNTYHCEQSNLESDKDVQWCMEVISYGLGLPLSEHDTIKDCVNIYYEWLMALLTPKSCVPKPVCDEPNLYARKMIQHLYNLFKPRQDAAQDSISKQAVLCHRVLRIIQTVAKDSTIITWETWETMLLFLLAINNTLLAPPTVKDDIGDHMCERVLSVLFEIWLLACCRSFPTPPLWKTFRDVCILWRHRPPLVEQWNRVNLALTSRLLKFMYGPDFPQLKIPDDDANLVPSDMSNECVAQTWFRFLHTLHNPVDLHRSAVISQTPKFLHYAITSGSVVDPCQHPCLSVLPQVFLRAMKGIAMLADAFLGICQSSENEKQGNNAVKFAPPPTSVTPPQQRRIAKSFSVSAASGATKGHQKSSLIGGTKWGHAQSASTSASTSAVQVVFSVEPRPPLAPGRPKCNSILHLFGAWLFEAALIGANVNDVSILDVNVSKSGDSRRSSSVDSFEVSSPVATCTDSFEFGRAEAIGCLCRIFCAKKTGEEILPVYLARFYLAVEQGLKMDQNVTGQILCSILLNSCDLLRLDLDGVQVLVPHFLEALEMVLPERELNLKGLNSVSQVELRRASINMLLSLLPLPLHFRHLPIREIGSVKKKIPQTFHNLRPRMVNLLFNALQCEVDSINTQMLLGGLLLCVQDAAAVEAVEQSPLQQDTVVGASTNLQCSGSMFSRVGLTLNVSDSVSSGSASDFSVFVQDDIDSCSPCDSAHALFVRATYLVCHRLISSWKTDLNVSLAALELLAGFAKIKIQEQEAMECKRAVKWICDYIVSQCSRPPPAHSKDLHSSIVAAFQCVSAWLVEHPYLLQDKECLNTVLEVVELGISGSKSQAKHTDTPCMKSDKMCKPASMRVRDAAEATLGCILDCVGAFPSPCGPETLSSLLDEEALLSFCNSCTSVNKEEALRHFSFYVVENAHILALLEQPLGNDQDPQPTVTLLNRGPFGRHAWAMQLRHLPRHKSGTKCLAVNPGRPLPMCDLGTSHATKPRYFPESVDRIPFCKAESSIPLLESLLNDDKIAAEHDKISRILDSQIAFEEKVDRQNEAHRSEYPNPETECKAPDVCQEFQTGRLFLSHFGFLSLEALKESVTCPLPSLVRLDNSHSNFAFEVDALDNMSSRTYDTVFVFYVKSGQKTAHEILSNVNSRENVHSCFLEFLLSLGWPVDVAKHPGWTGHVSTSWKVLPTSDSTLTEDNNIHGGSLYNGYKQVLYWSDFSSELAFVVPSLKGDSVDSLEINKQNVSFDRMAPERHTMPQSAPFSHHDGAKPRTLSLDLDKIPLKDQESPADARSKKFGRQYSAATGCDMKMMVVWLESYEDHTTFPLGDLLQQTTTGENSSSTRPTEKDIFVIFIHALLSGLFRIHVQGQNNRISSAIPLMDGMVVSRRVLGTLIRQTTLNMCRRKRMENEGFQPPHVRRKLKIQEIATKHGVKMNEAEFYSSLFG